MFQFSLFGFPIQVQPFFWLTCLFLGGALSAQNAEDWIVVGFFALIAFVSIIAHELGHAWMGRKYGARPAIALHGLGGVTVLPGGSFSRIQSIQVSAAGPLCSLGVAAICYGILLVAGPTLPRDAVILLAMGYRLNILWTILNLMPIQPLDGGQILREALGPRHEKVACLIGGIVGVALTLWAVQQGQWFLAIFAAILAFTNFKGSATFSGGVLQR
jgi:Zn-dependent protease